MNSSAVLSQTSSPRFPLSPSPHRKVAIAVDLSDESAYAVRWAAEQYLRPGDSVVLLHVRPTTVLYGADWGWVPVDYTLPVAGDKKSEDDFDALTTAKATELAQPLVEAGIEYKIHIVKDRDMKERLCLEVERLGLSAVIMGSRGFGAVAASKRSLKMARLGSVSDYCVQHCVCPVVVVRCPDDVERRFGGGDEAAEDVLLPVPEEDLEGNEDDELKGFIADGFSKCFNFISFIVGFVAHLMFCMVVLKGFNFISFIAGFVALLMFCMLV